MEENINKKISIESLCDGIPVIPEEAVGFYKNNCMVCFHHQGHKSGVILFAAYKNITNKFQIYWTGEVTD